MRCQCNIFIICMLFFLPVSVISADFPDSYNVMWNTPSLHSGGSMPIGNGDIGLNLWVEQNGDLFFYISKTDAWSGIGRLLKLGKVRIRLSPNPFTDGSPFSQELMLSNGEIVISAGSGQQAVSLRIWVDANYPVVRVEAESPTAFQMETRLELWRKQARQLTDPDELHSAYGLQNSPNPVIEEADSILPAESHSLTWFHRNTQSCYTFTLENQSLGDLIAKYPDPLMHRTFGGCMMSDSMESTSDTSLVSLQPRKKYLVKIYALTAQTETSDQWQQQLSALSAADNADVESARSAHQAWWNAFWNKSWIKVYGSAEAETVTRGYTLQRWINACGGRGAYPIKFNGSIFTVDTRAGTSSGFDADYRKWGGCYWFQNTRLPYTSMLAGGDYELMQPLFKMYMDALPMRMETTEKYFNHEGAFFGETIEFWGSYCNNDWNLNNGFGNTGTIAENPWIRYYWTGSVELITMMLDYYDQTQDAAFVTETLVPFAEQIMKFFDQHWPRGADGKILFSPAQSLETWHTAVNPLPEIAGLSYTLHRLLKLPAAFVTTGQVEGWKKTLLDLPDLPIQTTSGDRCLLPAQQYSNSNNSENCEMYAVFPYRMYGLGKADLSTSINTFAKVAYGGTGGWRQNAIDAAYLGRTENARDFVAANFSTKDPNSRFPAFWGPNFDWTPDQDHGNVAMIALQRMLLQTEGRRMILLPAWPENWNSEFKLMAPYQTIIQGTVENGKLIALTVTPESRRQDVMIGLQEWEVLSPAESQASIWKYTGTAPSAVWSGIDFNDSQWQTGLAGFGSPQTPGGFVLASWDGADLWLRKSFYLEALTPEQKNNLTLTVSLCGEADIYLNGVAAAAVSEDTCIFNKNIQINQAARDAFKPGETNIIAVYCRSTKERAYIDIGIKTSGLSLIRKSSIEFRHRYEADSATPDIENASEGWTLEQTATSGQTFAVNTGILSYSTTAVVGLRNFQQKDPADAWPSFIDPGTSWTAEIKARVTASGGKFPGMAMKIENGAKNVSLIISENSIFWKTTVLDTLATVLDNASAFHIYRIAYNAPLQFYTVWRDTLAVGADIEKAVKSGKKTLSVGDVDAMSSSAAEIDYFRWCGDGAFAPVDISDGIKERGVNFIRSFILEQNYPNPFNPTTCIRFQIPQASRVRLDIFNIQGQHIRTLIDQHCSSGEHEVVWDGRNDEGIMAGSGLYFYRLNWSNGSQTRKMLLVR